MRASPTTILTCGHLELDDGIHRILPTNRLGPTKYSLPVVSSGLTGMDPKSVSRNDSGGHGSLELDSPFRYLTEVFK